MKEILNNICFSYDGIDFNVPINAPWEIYTGLVRSASEYDENIDRSDIDPYFILHLTERCNLKCKYCFEGEKGQRDIIGLNTLNLKNIKNLVLDFLVESLHYELILLSI